MKNISIIIIDDHPLFRQGVADIISLEEGFLVESQASNGEEGLSLIRANKPDVAIIDVNLPGLNGQQITRQIVEEKLPTRVLLLTAYDDREQQLHAMRVGAAAYCTKDVHPAELVAVIRAIVAGDYVIGESVYDRQGITEWLEKEVTGDGSKLAEHGEPLQPLSLREMEVLTLISRGLSNKEIAVSLGISHQTVKNHVTSILRKLGVEDRTQAALYALQRGWVRLYQQ